MRIGQMWVFPVLRCRTMYAGVKQPSTERTSETAGSAYMLMIAVLIIGNVIGVAH